MRHALLIAGISVLAASGPALAQTMIPLHTTIAAAPDVQLAQVQVQVPAPPGTVVATPGSPPPPGAVVTTPAVPAAPPGTTVVVTAPTAPPPPQPETPPPPPAPNYVWTPGHWSWNGTQYAWDSGSYVVPPTAAAHWTPGHWLQSPAGWTWVAGSWD